MPARVSVLVVLAATLIAAGCGSSSEPAATTTSTATATATTTATTTTAKAAGGGDAVSVLSSTIRVSPTRAGTSARPQGVVLHAALRLRQPPDVDPPLAKAAELRLSSGTRFDGGATAACSLQTIEQRGQAACPEGAHIGMGTVAGKADTARASGDIQVLNGGPRRIYLATKISHPVVAEGVVRGDVTSGTDGVVIHLTFPESLQTVAGVPLGLTDFVLDVGRGTVLSTTGCPDGHWTYAASVSFAGTDDTARHGPVRCS